MKKQYEKLKEKIEEFFKGFVYFLKNTLILFKQNYKPVIQFILFTSVFITIATSILRNLVFNLMMKVSGTTYITSFNMMSVLTNPGSILLIVFLLIVVTFMSLFEIAGLLHAFSMGQVGRETNLSSMFMAGFRICKKASNPKNWLVILFILVLFPLTKVLPLSSCTFKVILTGFIEQIIDYTSLYSRLYSIFYFCLICAMVVYMFSINIFVLQKSDFIKSCDRSRRLQKGHYFNTFFTMILLTLILNVTINSVSSVIIINVQELVSLFEKNLGVVTKSFNIGNNTYILRQILKSLLSPAVNNAALTVLFYRYIEEKNLMRALSADIFKETESQKSGFVRVLYIALFGLLVCGIILVSNFTYLSEPVSRPMVCAHRGDNYNAPENTMPAFELAVSENLPWIELDVHQTSDGVIICNHDKDLSRVTGEKITIHDHTYAELKKCEFGDWMPGNYEHVTVPTLEEVLLMAKENNMHVQVELKGHADDVNFEENVLEVINKTGMHDNVMIICLNADRTKRIDELDPSILKAYCTPLAIGRMEDIEFTDNISIEEKNVNPEIVERFHALGKKVFCWTVDTEETIQYLVSCNVDVIGTNNPTLVLNALDKVDYSGGFARVFHIIMNVLYDMNK